jgi:hypothetical protein
VCHNTASHHRAQPNQQHRPCGFTLACAQHPFPCKTLHYVTLWMPPHQSPPLWAAVRSVCQARLMPRVWCEAVQSVQNVCPGMFLWRLAHTVALHCTGLETLSSSTAPSFLPCCADRPSGASRYLWQAHCTPVVTSKVSQETALAPVGHFPVQQTPLFQATRLAACCRTVSVRRPTAHCHLQGSVSTSSTSLPGSDSTSSTPLMRVHPITR